MDPLIDFINPYKREASSNNTYNNPVESWLYSSSYPNGRIDTTYYDRPETVSATHMIGMVTPSFHARVRQGELIPFTYFRKFAVSGLSYGTFLALTQSPLPYFKRRLLPNANLWPYWVLAEGDLDPYLQSAKLYVQQSASKIYSSGYDLLTSLAEFGEVKTMWCKLAKNFATFIRHGVSPSFLRNTTLKKVANTWLEGRYGWRTFMYDLKNLHEVVSRLNVARQRYSQRSGNEYTTHSYSTVTNYVTECYYAVDYHDVINISLRGTVAADIDVPQFQTNLLQTGWELIPLSFVVDWFLSVGKSISALSFLMHAKRYTAAEGCRVSIQRSAVAYATTKRTGCTNVTYDQRMTCNAALELRTPCSVSLSPQLVLNRLDLSKVIDLLSLIYQRLH